MADVLIKTLATDANGKVSFTGLPPGNYKYVQDTAKTGYTKDATEYSISITNATPVTATRENTPTEVGTLTIQKHVENYTDYHLAGATFKLMDASGKTMLTESVASNTAGDIELQNLMSITNTPQTYKIVEVTPPTNYNKNTQEYSPVVTVSANTDQPVPNTPTTAGQLDVTLEDTNYNEYTLQGADYKLYLVTP